MNRASAEIICAYYLACDTFPIRKIIVVDLAPQPKKVNPLMQLSESFARLDYRPCPNIPYFNKPFALNIGAAASKAPFMLFCDADIMVTMGTLRGLREASRPGSAIIIKDIVETSGDVVRAGPGIIYVSRQDFLGVGGYNSALTGWGYEDRDFIDRLKLNGCEVTKQGTAFHISHSDAVRIENYQEKDLRRSRNRNSAVSQLAISSDLKGSYLRDTGQGSLINED